MFAACRMKIMTTFLQNAACRSKNARSTCARYLLPVISISIRDCLVKVQRTRAEKRSQITNQLRTAFVLHFSIIGQYMYEFCKFIMKYHFSCLLYSQGPRGLARNSCYQRFVEWTTSIINLYTALQNFIS